MTDNKLELIRQYCDTTGVRLHEWEKDLLCKVLSSPAYYNGFESRVFEEKNSTVIVRKFHIYTGKIRNRVI